MNRTTGEANATRLVAWVVVVVSIGLIVGPVAAAGWQSGVDATAELHADVGATEADPTESGPMKRDGGTNGSDGPDETTKPTGANESVETGSMATSTSTGTDADTNGGGTDRATTATRTASGSEQTERTDHATDGRVTDEGSSRARCATDETITRSEPRANVRSSANEDRETLSALRSDLWIVGAFTGLTTLFSLGGFVAAVMAYRGTD